MRCPYCQTHTFEAAPRCAKCGLSLDKLDSLLGVSQVYPTGVVDRCSSLTGGQVRRLRSLVLNLNQSFPQIDLSVLFTNCDAEVPFQLFLFWIFNKAGISAEFSRGGQNRSILLGFDVGNQRAGITIGYGLEPFVGERHLDEALQAGRDALTTKQFAVAAESIINKLKEILLQIHSQLAKTYGVPPTELGTQPAKATRELDPELAY